MKFAKKLILAAFFLFILSIFFANSLHEMYPDEFDNVLGGWNILHGSLPNIGFFTHHAPMAYFVAAILLKFSGNSFVRFRITYGIFLFLLNLLSYFVVKKSLKKDSGIYFVFLPILAITSTYYWGQMLVADSLAGLFFLPVFVILLVKLATDKPITTFDLIISSIFTSLCLLTSLTFSFLILAVDGFLFFSRKNLKTLLILFIPYLFFGVYLVSTGSLKSFYEDNFIFNTRFYIYNYPKAHEDSPVNPVRYVIVIAHNFFQNYHSLLVGVTNFNLGLPFNMTLAVANLSLVVFLLLTKKFKAAIFVTLVCIYTNVRSSPWASGEKDYQSALYIVVSLFTSLWVWYSLYQFLNSKQKLGQKIIFTTFFILLTIYNLANFFYLFRKFEEKMYGKFMGELPLVYDRPQIAPVVNKIITPADFAWIGPFEFEELFYLKARNPSRFQILLPEFYRYPPYKNKMLDDFEKNMPQIIVFRRGVYIRFSDPTTANKFFTDFLDENYIRLAGHKEGEWRYTSVIPHDPNSILDIDADFYLRKDLKDQLINKMLEEKLIKKIKTE